MMQQQVKPITQVVHDKAGKGKFVDVLCLIALVILVGVTFGRSLESFFIADDFGEVSYVHRIFSGEWNLFWSNFVGNYMQIPSMAVWRPWLLATLVFDYAVWKANAFGYYLTNILYYAGNSILIYALTRRLTQSWTAWRSQATSFFTAALFTASPLHCESVTWVVGRVDIACCFYYLLSFLLLLNTGRWQKLTTTIATISFWLALWTKEMAIGLPVMVTATHLLAENNLRPIEKLKLALLKASPLWLSTLLYFPLRYAFLGTLTGGYTGSIGASQFAGLLKRWSDPDTLHRIVYPLNYSLFQGESIYSSILTAIYSIAGAVIVTRLLNRELSLKWSALLILWFATCAVPIYQLWGLGYDLEGSRFYYFLSLPLSFALPLLLLQPAATQNASTRKWPIVLSIATLLVLTLTLSKIAYVTNMTWVHAGKETKAVFEESKKLAQDKTSHIVLGLPKRNSAAHMIFNGETYRLMLKPPFTETSIADKFITFEPILFGPAEFINTERFKKILLAEPNTFVWSSKEKKFKPVIFEKATATLKPLPLRANSKINPLSYDFLAFDVQTKEDQSVEFKANWNIGSDESGQATITTQTRAGMWQTVYMPVSRYWRWFAKSQIVNLNLLPTETKQVSVSNPRLLQSSIVAPSLATECTPDTTGVYKLTNKELHFAVKRASTDPISIQISKPDFFFENFSPQDQLQAVEKTILLPNAQTSFSLDDSYFVKPGFYQIRAVAQNKDAIVASDAITVQRLP